MHTHAQNSITQRMSSGNKKSQPRGVEYDLMENVKGRSLFPGCSAVCKVVTAAFPFPALLRYSWLPSIAQLAIFMVGNINRRRAIS